MPVFRKKNVWIVLAAAFALLVQSAVGIAAPIRAGEALALDAFGNPLCQSDAGRRDHDGHSRLPDCCTLGCSMFFPAAGAPPGAIEIKPRSLPGVGAECVRPVFVHRAQPAYKPGNPRAPPVTA